MERGAPESLVDEGSSGIKGRAYVIIYLFFDVGIFFEPPKEMGAYAGVDFVYEH